MERRFKERLIGAIVLVGLGVLVLPAVLNGPRPSGQPPEATDVEGSMRSETIELEPQPDTPQESQVPPARKPVATETSRPVESATAPATGEPSTSATSAPTPSPPAQHAPPVPASDASGSGGWAVQVGTFASASNAEALTSRLKELGQTAFVLPYTEDGKTLFRVRVGPVPDLESARALKQRLAALHIEGAPVRNP